jgi:hypothetical protein
MTPSNELSVASLPSFVGKEPGVSPWVFETLAIPVGAA